MDDPASAPQREASDTHFDASFVRASSPPVPVPAEIGATATRQLSGDAGIGLSTRHLSATAHHRGGVNMSAIREELDAFASAATRAINDPQAAAHMAAEKLVKEPIAKLRNTEAYQRMGKPLETAIAKPINKVTGLAKAEIDRLELKLRARFQGYDDSNSAQKLQERKIARFRALFDSLDPGGRGAVPVDELEDLFTAAGLYESRTVVGQLAYDADADGNGALDFGEFTSVLDQLGNYHREYLRQGKAKRQVPAAAPALAAGAGASAAAGSSGTGLASGATPSPAVTDATAPADATAVDDEPAGESESFLFGSEGATLTFREVIYRTLDDPTFSRFSRIVAFIVFSAILLAVAVFLCQSYPELDPDAPYFTILEAYSVAVFTVDYLGRLATCPNRWKFFWSASSLIDLLTIAPYYLDEINEVFHPKGGFGAAMRILRLLRILRILKISKYVPFVNLMSSAIKSSAAPLCMAMLVMSIGTLLLAAAMMYAERGEWDPELGAYLTVGVSPSDPTKVPTLFTDIGACFYWALVTLSTVGYGDLYPVTGWGKIVGSVTALTGCVLVAFPVSIYTEAFSKEYAEFKQTQALAEELGYQDLLSRLEAARSAQLLAPQLPRFPPSLAPGALQSLAAPRNLQLMRWARAQVLERVYGVRLPLPHAGGGREAVLAPASGTGGDGSAGSSRGGSADGAGAAAARPVDDDWFLSVWGAPAAKAAADALATGGSAIDGGSGELTGVQAYAYADGQGPEDTAHIVTHLPPPTAPPSPVEGGDPFPTLAGSASPTAPPAATAPANPPPGGGDAQLPAPSEPAIFRALLSKLSSASTASEFERNSESASADSDGGAPPARQSESEADGSALLRSAGDAAGVVDDGVLLVAAPPHQPSPEPAAAAAAPASALPATEGRRVMFRQPSFEYEPAVVRGATPGGPEDAAVAGAVDRGAATVEPAARRRPQLSASLATTGNNLLSAFSDTIAPLGAAPAPKGGAGAGGGGVGGPEAESVLRPESFVMSDLLSDEQLSRAILALLNDHRKRVWGQVRALEAKFRDDLGIEFARRWVAWMAMAPDLVEDAARPFVFRKRELGRAMGFQRSSVGVGFVGAAHERRMAEETAKEHAAAEARRAKRRARATSSSAGVGPRGARAERLGSLDINNGRERADTSDFYAAASGIDAIGSQGSSGEGPSPWGHGGSAQQRDAMSTLAALFSRADGGTLGAAPSGLQAVPFFFQSVLGPALATLPAAASQLGRGAVTSIQTSLEPEVVRKRLAALTGLQLGPAPMTAGAPPSTGGTEGGVELATLGGQGAQQQHASGNEATGGPAAHDTAGVGTGDVAHDEAAATAAAYQKRLLDAYVALLASGKAPAPAHALPGSGSHGPPAALTAVPRVGSGARVKPSSSHASLTRAPSFLVDTEDLEAVEGGHAARGGGRAAGGSGSPRANPRPQQQGGAAGAAASATTEGRSSWVQTAFGLSHLPQGLQSVSSSFAAGTASVAGQGAAAPSDVPMNSYGINLEEMSEANMFDPAMFGLPPAAGHAQQRGQPTPSGQGVVGFAPSVAHPQHHPVQQLP